MRLIAACLVLAAAPIAAQEELDRRIDELERRHDESRKSYPDRFEELRPEYEAIAREHPGTPAALRARIFLLRGTWWQRQAGTMHAAAGEIADRILEDHIGSPGLWRLVEAHFVLDAEQKRRIYTRVRNESPHPDVVAAAVYGLARIARGDERRALLEELRDRHGDATYRSSRCRDLAEALLSPHAPDDLAVGREAPEIAGRTHDGRPLRLGDHRGKVVLLVFWGDW